MKKIALGLLVISLTITYTVMGQNINNDPTYSVNNYKHPNKAKEAKEIIWEGLNLTPIVLVPHVDNMDFGAGCREAGELCRQDGYPTQWITDAQAFLINGDEQRVV